MTDASTENNPPAQETGSQPPSPAETQPHNPPAHQPQVNPLQSLMDSLDALPEKVAKAVSEAFPKPVKQTPAPAKSEPNTMSAASANSPTTPPNTPTKPGKKSFGEWWFGR